MSVINDMLRDLDARKAPERDGMAGEGHSLVQSQVKPKWHLPAAIVVIIALILGAFWLGGAGENHEPLTQAYLPPSSEGTAIEPSGPEIQQSTTDRVAEPDEQVRIDEPVAHVVSKAESARLEKHIASERALPQENKRVTQSERESEPAAVVAKVQKKQEKHTEVDSAKKTKSLGEPRASVAKPEATGAAEMVADKPSKKVLEEGTSVVRLTPTAQDQQVAKQNQKRLEKGEASFAIQTLYAFIADSEQDNYSRTVLATYLMQTQRFAEAGDVLTPVDFDDLPALRVLKARWLLQTYDVARAIQWLETNPPEVSKDRDYAALLANYYQQAGQFEKSVETYAELLEFNSEKGEWWLGLGVGYDRLKRYDDAAYAYRQAIVSPKLKTSLVEFARVRLEQLTR